MSRLIAVLAWTLFTTFATADEARTPDSVKKKIAEILAPPAKQPANALTGEREAAVRRLNAIRYVAGVPHDVVLDEELNDFSQSGAKLLEKIGKLDHTPTNPGLPEDEFKKAYRGTSSANLGQGFGNLVQAVDGWMDDSDKGNIDAVGHRRWCINPAMKKTGFGKAGEFTVMHSFDSSRRPAPDFDYIAWPARGSMPVEFFRANYAWNVSLNPRKYQMPDENVKPKVYELDKDGKKTGEPLKLNYSGVNVDGYGVPFCVIFRPEKLTLAPGKRYLVELEGVKMKGKAAEVRYEVEFFTMK